MDVDLQAHIHEAQQNGVSLEALLLFSITVSLKRIADSLASDRNPPGLGAPMSQSLADIANVKKKGL